MKNKAPDDKTKQWDQAISVSNQIDTLLSKLNKEENLETVGQIISDATNKNMIIHDDKANES